MIINRRAKKEDISLKNGEMSSLILILTAEEKTVGSSVASLQLVGFLVEF